MNKILYLYLVIFLYLTVIIQSKKLKHFVYSDVDKDLIIGARIYGQDSKSSLSHFNYFSLFIFIKSKLIHQKTCFFMFKMNTFKYTMNISMPLKI